MDFLPPGKSYLKEPKIADRGPGKTEMHACLARSRKPAFQIVQSYCFTATLPNSALECRYTPGLARLRRHCKQTMPVTYPKNPASLLACSYTSAAGSERAIILYFTLCRTTGDPYALRHDDLQLHVSIVNTTPRHLSNQPDTTPNSLSTTTHTTSKQLSHTKHHCLGKPP